MQTFVDVILPVPLDGYFTYSAPSDLVNSCQIGKRTIVQFGSKKIYTAIIARIHDNAPTEYKTKDIIAILDQKPIVNEIQLSFWKWISEYYMCPIGDVYKAALPSALKLESESSLSFNPEFDDLFNEKKDISLSEKELLVLDLIKNKDSVKLKELPSLIQSQNITSVVKSLIDKGAVKPYETIKEKYTEKKEAYVKLSISYSNSESLNELLNSLKRAPQQQRLILNYLKLIQIDNEQTTFREIKKEELLKTSNVSSSVLKSLLDKEIFLIEEKKQSRLFKDTIPITEPSTLNPKQAKAYSEIKESFKEKNVCLLHGVTSSGKTELYIHLIKEYMDQGKQVLYLLPEIALTTQIITRLQNIFGNKAGVYHSKFNDAERVEIWNNIAQTSNDETETFQLILGARSSVFLPFRNLGLIIIDEEHENTYKQFDPAPRYHARDAAIYLAVLHGAKTLLGTATPSVDSYYNALGGKFGLVHLLSRFREIKLPEFKVIDTLSERKKRKMKSHFSFGLLDQIKSSLKEGKQIILFQNRRGFAPYIECRDCGWIPYCKHCNVSLTYHKFNNQLTCHYCGYGMAVPQNCPDCKQPKIETRGFGTEKIEEEIQLLFPEARTERLDVDTTRSKFGHKKIISEFENGQIDILIGTQMVSKGLDFENVSLVGILNADQLLNYPDFRANERSFQLMSQVGGRSGRKNKQGLVIVQTSDPNHYIIRCVTENNFEKVFKQELHFRKIFKYPPFFRIIELTLKHRDRTRLDKGSDLLADILRQKFNERVLGPEYPVIDKIHNLYLKKILLKIEKEKPIAKAKEITKRQIARISAIDYYKSLQVVINVDPY